MRGIPSCRKNVWQHCCCRLEGSMATLMLQIVTLLINKVTWCDNFDGRNPEIGLNHVYWRFSVSCVYMCLCLSPTCFVSSYLFCAYDVILQMVHSAGKGDQRLLMVFQIFYCTDGKNYVVVMFCDYENILRRCAYNNMVIKRDYSVTPLKAIIFISD